MYCVLTVNSREHLITSSLLTPLRVPAMITPRGGLKSPRPAFDVENFEPTEFVCHENTVRSKFEKFDSNGLGLNIREALSLVSTYISMTDTLSSW